MGQNRVFITFGGCGMWNSPENAAGLVASKLAGPFCRSLTVAVPVGWRIFISSRSAAMWNSLMVGGGVPQSVHCADSRAACISVMWRRNPSTSSTLAGCRPYQVRSTAATLPYPIEAVLTDNAFAFTMRHALHADRLTRFQQACQRAGIVH